VLRETTSRGLSGLVCPSRTSERGEEGDCVKEGGGGEGERAKERAQGLPLGGRETCWKVLLLGYAPPRVRALSSAL